MRHLAKLMCFTEVLEGSQSLVVVSALKTLAKNSPHPREDPLLSYTHLIPPSCLVCMKLHLAVGTACPAHDACVDDTLPWISYQDTAHCNEMHSTEYIALHDNHLQFYMVFPVSLGLSPLLAV